jgi:hypothetical protein
MGNIAPWPAKQARRGNCGLRIADRGMTIVGFPPWIAAVTHHKRKPGYWLDRQPEE